MNLKLGNVLSDITGQTGLAIVQAILDGQRDPHVLAPLRDPRCRHEEAEIAQALEGHWREDHLFELRQAVELYRFYRAKLAECDQQIEACLERFPDQSGGEVLPPQRRKKNPNAPAFDARSQLFRMTGVDLTAIDGLDANPVLKVVSEVGTDLTRWPTVKHFARGLCLCPGNQTSGGRRLSGKTRPSGNRAAAALRLAAQSLERSKTALGAFFRRMKARLGAPKAHKLACHIDYALRYGRAYVDLGQEAYEQQYQARRVHNLHRPARQLGYQLTLIPTPT